MKVTCHLVIRLSDNFYEEYTCLASVYLYFDTQHAEYKVSMERCMGDLINNNIVCRLSAF